MMLKVCGIWPHAGPGIQQAVDDLAFLVDMSGQTTSRLESDHRKMNDAMQDAMSETTTLKETLALQNQQKEDLQQEVSQLNKEIKQLNGKLDAANREVQQQKQVRWVRNLRKVVALHAPSWFCRSDCQRVQVQHVQQPEQL